VPTVSSSSACVRRLPLRVPAKQFEPGHSLLVRLSVRHREVDVGVFARNIGVPMQRAMYGHNIDSLASLAGVEIGPLALFSPKIDMASRLVDIGYGHVRLGDWSVSKRRWCSRCLADDLAHARGMFQRLDTATFHRFWWDVSSIGTCPYHNVNLCEQCPQCQRSVEWGGRSLHICACGCSLTLTAEAEMPSIDPVDAYLVRRLCGECRAAVPILDMLPCYEVLSFLERLGLASRAGWRKSKPVASNEERRSAQSTGFHIALDIEQRFVALLDDIAQQSQSNSHCKGLIGTYGWVYSEWVSALPDVPAYQTLKALLREHALTRGIVALGEPILEEHAQQEAINLREASKILRTDCVRARQILDSHGLIPRGARRGVAIPISKSEVERVSALSARQLSLKAVGQHLGIGKAHVRHLISAGLISSKTEGCHLPRVDRSQVIDFLQQMVRGVRRRSPPPGSKPLPVACRNMQIPLTFVCQLIILGRIKPVAVEPGMLSLARVFVRCSDLREYRLHSFGLSVEESARQLQVHPETVRYFVRCGLLPTLHEGGSKLIDPAELRRFGMEHVAASELARDLKSSPRYVTKRLNEIGIPYIVGPPVCRQTIFARRAVAAVMQQLGAAPTDIVRGTARRNRRISRKHSNPSEGTGQIRGRDRKVLLGP
jgi:hypothetical protein